MKLNLVERLITNNPILAFIQRHVEGPMLRKMGSREAYPLCREIGSGRGIGAQVIIKEFSAEKVIARDLDPNKSRGQRKFSVLILKWLMLWY